MDGNTKIGGFIMGFKVIKDCIKEENRTGAVGTESIPPTHWLKMRTDDDPNDLARYKYSGGDIKVRLLDDDQNIYYHGLVDDDEFSCELFLDWGTSYAGAVALEMHIDSYKKLFGEPEHPQLLSKDGKWYSYMS